MNKVFILGAGFTKSYAPNAPLLCDDYGGIELLEKFKEFPWSRKILNLEMRINSKNKVNLERLMTRLEGQMPYDFEGEAREQFALLLSQLKIKLKERLERLREGEIFENELENFAYYCVENKYHCITFNYDDILDEALYKRKMGGSPHNSSTWHPDGGYGFFCLPAYSTVSRPSLFMDQTSMLLLKLHGSLNWRPIRGATQPFAVNDIVHHEPWLSHEQRSYYKRNTGTDFPDFIIEGHLNPEPFIVPPILIKPTLVEQPILRLLWSLAYKILQEADAVFFLGYSLPITDIAAGFLFSEGLSNLDPSKITIVTKPMNKKAKENIQTSYLQIFPRIKKNQFVFEDIRIWAKDHLLSGTPID